MAKILVADDSPEILHVLSMILRDAGHDTTTASDGHEALQLLELNHYDLLITDIVMPNKEGIETIIAARRKAPDLKIIAMSGGGSWMTAQQYLDMASKLGAAKVLPKPFSRTDALLAISQVLGET
jgi:Response regulator containing CheY-like receiver, AAA-type ATPase, and DNA-binding domains